MPESSLGRDYWGRDYWVVATSDGPLADRCGAIVDLVGPILAARGGWVVDLRG